MSAQFLEEASITKSSNGQNCGSRLPCGLCLITNHPCPFIVQTVEPYWKYGVTCTTTGTTATTTDTTGGNNK